MKEKILVTYAATYSIKDETTGSMNDGCSVHFYFWGENGSNFKTMTPRLDGDKLGYQRSKASLPFNSFSNFHQVPAIYDGVFELVTGSDGKPVLKLIDATYAMNVVFSEQGADIKNK